MLIIDTIHMDQQDVACCHNVVQDCVTRCHREAMKWSAGAHCVTQSVHLLLHDVDEVILRLCILVFTGAVFIS